MELASVSVLGTTARTPSGATNAYVLGADGALLVDPGNRTDELDTAVERVEVAHLAVTHHHGDHVDAVPEYAGKCGATVWARAGRVDAFVSGTGISPDRTFAPGSRIPAGDGEVTVIDTPGHAPEHVAFAFEGGVLTGDLAVEPGTVVVGHPSGDMRAYLSSLRRLWARDPSMLYPGHGEVIDDPRATLERLVDHRLNRERRVLTAVCAGARTVSSITDAAYEKDVSAVRGLAEATVRAHLEKLAAEGSVQWDGDTVEPT